MQVHNVYHDGFFNYSDLATQSSPIAYTANADTKLTNDTLGVQTLTTYKPSGVTRLWNSVTNQFDFSQLILGDELLIRYNIEVTTTTNSQEFYMFMNLAIGGNAYSLYDGVWQFKNQITKQINTIMPIYIGNSDTITKPAEILFHSDSNATVKVNGFYISVKRRF